MLLELKFDDPSRTADYGYFASERGKPLVLTGSDLADAIQTGVEPIGAPFKEWLPKLTEGWRFELGLVEIRATFQAMLDDERVNTAAMDILNDVAHENYGADA